MIYKVLGLLGLLVLVVSMGEVFAQAPQAIPFSAAVRNANGVLIPNKAFLARFTIIDGSSIINVDSSNIAYRETQTVATNNQGLFVINIGQGAVAKGIFSNINWSVNSKYVQVEIDTTNTGGVYRVISTQQLMSVPYALNARKADSAINGVPPGTIVAFGGDTAHVPDGWLLCDGQSLSTSEVKYKSLYAAIGTNWGSTSTGFFSLPYTWGLFLRGCTNGHPSSDPDAKNRTQVQTNGNTGDKVGSFQLDSYASHTHGIRLEYGNGTSPSYPPGGTTSTVTNDKTGYPFNKAGNSISIEGGNETRPKNIYVNYIIKL